MKKLCQYLPIIALLALQSYDAMGLDKIAKVIQLSGKVSQKLPGGISPLGLKADSDVIRRSVLKTNKESYLKIFMLTDGTSITLGPETRVVIDLIKNSNSIFINVIDGKLRIQRQKESGNFKLFLRTPTAGLGVDVADFLFLYNARNKVTTTLTFSGQTSFSRLRETEDPYKKKRRTDKNAKLKKNRKGGYNVAEEMIELTQTEEKILTDYFVGDQAAIVKPGQMSMASWTLKKVSRPMKISPIQYQTLYQNQFVYSRKRSQIEPMEITDLSPTNIRMLQADQEAPEEGFFNTETNDFSFKVGGLIDLDTCLYIIPNDQSEFNARYRVYIDSTIGKIDKQTGQYIAPEGIGLHESRGFLPLNRKYKKEKKIFDVIKQLDTQISKDIVLIKTKSKLKLSHDVYSSRKELFTKNQVIMSVRLAPTSINITGSPFLGTKDIVSSSSIINEFAWLHSSNTRWQTVTTIANKLTTLELDSNIEKPSSNSLWMASFGVRWFWSPTWSFLWEAQVDQNFYLLHPNETGTPTNEIGKITLTRTKMIFESSWFKTKRFSMDIDLGFHVTLPKDLDKNSETGFSFGAWYSAGVKFWLNNHWWSKLEYWGYSDVQSLDYGSYDYTHSRVISGAGLSFARVF